MKLYSLQMKLQLYEITFSHLQLRTQKFESQCNPLTRSINKETPLQCNLCASYRLACFCLKKQIQIAQWTQTLSRFLGESYNFPGCPSRQNLESKPQLGKKKKKKKHNKKPTSPLSPLSHHFQVKNEAFFCNQTLKHIFWTTMWVPASTL